MSLRQLKACWDTLNDDDRAGLRAQFVPDEIGPWIDHKEGDDVLQLFVRWGRRAGRAGAHVATVSGCGTVWNWTAHVPVLDPTCAGIKTVEIKGGAFFKENAMLAADAALVAWIVLGTKITGVADDALLHALRGSPPAPTSAPPEPAALIAAMRDVLAEIDTLVERRPDETTIEAVRRVSAELRRTRKASSRAPRPPILLGDPNDHPAAAIDGEFQDVAVEPPSEHGTRVGYTPSDSGKLAFRVWAPDDSDEADARLIHARDPADAARCAGEERYYDGDYPKEQTFAVRHPDGTATFWIVSAEQSTDFSVRAAPGAP
ncbi:MAG: hypothetical protein ACHREM_08970 [Polyangiales bacterium]